MFWIILNERFSCILKWARSFSFIKIHICIWRSWNDILSTRTKLSIVVKAWRSMMKHLRRLINVQKIKDLNDWVWRSSQNSSFFVVNVTWEISMNIIFVRFLFKIDCWFFEFIKVKNFVLQRRYILKFLTFEFSRLNLSLKHIFHDSFQMIVITNRAFKHCLFSLAKIGECATCVCSNFFFCFWKRSKFAKFGEFSNVPKFDVSNLW